MGEVAETIYTSLDSMRMNEEEKDELYHLFKENPDALDLLDIFKEGFYLYLKKNKDYRDAWKKHGLYGLIVRMGDKMERLENLVQFRGRKVRDEKARDTALDLAVYGMLSVLSLDKYSNDGEKK